MSATMLSVRDAADRLGVSYSALKQWIYKGTVRTVRSPKWIGSSASRTIRPREPRPGPAPAPHTACWWP